VLRRTRAGAGLFYVCSAEALGGSVGAWPIPCAADNRHDVLPCVTYRHDFS
jgi:hypothetical protein